MIEKIEFINAENQTIIEHSLNFSKGLLEVKINSEKLIGEDNFSYVPRRVEVKMLKDDYLEEHFLTVNYEYIGISKVFLKYFINDELVFTGFIDSSFIEYDAKTEIISLIAYDYLKKYTVPNVETSLKPTDNPFVNSANASKTINELISLCNEKISFFFPVHNAVSTPLEPLKLVKSVFEIYKLNWADLIGQFSDWSITEVKYGFNYNDIPLYVNTANIFRVFFAGIQPNNMTAEAKLKVYAKTFYIFNNVCLLEIERDAIDEETDFLDETEYQRTYEQLTWKYLDFGDYFYTTTIGSNQYNVEPLSPSDYDVSGTSVPSFKTLTFSGQIIPDKITFKNEYFKAVEVLKTILLLNNLTIKCNKYSKFVILRKDFFEDSVISIDNKDITAFKLSRDNLQKIPFDLLDNLLGDTTPLKKVLNDYYNNNTSKFKLDVSIDNIIKYNIEIGRKIVIDNVYYTVTEITKDYVNDEHQIKARRLENEE